MSTTARTEVKTSKPSAGRTKVEPVGRKQKRFRARRVVFTVHEAKWKPEPSKFTEKVRFVTGQTEIGEQTQKEHFQGYAQFKKELCSRKAVYKALGLPACFVEVAHGTPTQNVEYVTKEETRKSGTTPFEWGTRTNADATGKGAERSDLQEVLDKLKEGVTMDDIMDEHGATWVRNYKALAKYEDRIRERKTPDWKPIEVIVLWGDAGANKSRTAISMAKTTGGGYYRAVVTQSGNVWFNKYQGERTLILDEFYGQLKFSYVLKLLDGYKMEVERKGDTTWAQWDRVIITSNTHPREWYTSSRIPEQSLSGFRRRINQIVHMVNDKRSYADFVQEQHGHWDNEKGCLVVEPKEERTTGPHSIWNFGAKRKRSESEETLGARVCICCLCPTFPCPVDSGCGCRICGRARRRSAPESEDEEGY